MKFIKNNYYWIFYALLTIIIFSGFIFSDELLFSSDQIESGIFFRKMYADFVENFLSFPLWDKFISGGLPFIDAMHGDSFYPAAFLKFFIPLHKALGLKLVLHIFMSGIFMFIYLQNLPLSKKSSFLGGLSYMTAPMLISLIYPGHDAKIYVATLLPLATTFLVRAMRKNKYYDYLCLGTIVGIMILSSHLQATYFALWFIFAYACFYWIVNYRKEKAIKNVLHSFSRFWFAMIIAICIGAIQLIPPYLYSKEFSIRGSSQKTSFEHAISWGMHPEEAVSLLAPKFSGENIKGENSYWGRNYFKLNSEYAGIIPIIFLFIGLVTYRDKFRKELYFFLGVAIFTLLYSLVNHTPLFNLAYKLIPGVKLFRAQSMILFIFSFVLSTSLAIVIDPLFNKEKSISESYEFSSKKLFLFTACLVCILLFPALLTKNFMSIYQSIFSPPRMPSQSYLSTISSSFMQSFIISISVLLTCYYTIHGKISQIWLLTIMTTLILFDNLSISTQFIETVNKNDIGYKFKEDKYIKAIKEKLKTEKFRVLNLNAYGNNELPIHQIETVRGFHDNELKWYRQFRGMDSRGVNNDHNLTNPLLNNKFLNIVGAKYLFFKDKNHDIKVAPNSTYLPRAFTVSKYLVRNNPESIVETIKSSTFQEKTTIILENKPQINLDLDTNIVHPGKVIKYDYDGNLLNVKVDMSHDGFLFMSDTYMPYWHAYDNQGNEIPIYKSNLAFRAIPLKKGNYNLTLKYISKPVILSQYLTLITSILAIIGIIIFNKKKV